MVRSGTSLPDDLVLEILTRLPGKPVGRCRCVCKSWRAVIGSRRFRDIYRERQRGLIIYWWSVINWDIGAYIGNRSFTRRLQFSHCPFRRLKEPLPEFSPLLKLDLESFGSRARPVLLTQLVDGLLCIGEGGDRYSSEFRLTLHNVCTGESMRIPDPLPCFACTVGASSSYHLGYDRESGEYKLLRLIYICLDEDDSILGAHTLTLSPPSSSHTSEWRVLDNDAAGISSLYASDIEGGCLLEVNTCSISEDGVLCWIHKPYHGSLDNLVCYDFSRERFWFVELPHDGKYSDFVAVTRHNDSLTIWLELKDEAQKKKVKCCYVLEGDEVKTWSRQSVNVSKHFEEGRGSVVASGKLPGSSHNDMLVMNHDNDERHSVHYYAEKDEDDVFFVGKLPDEIPRLNRESCYHQWEYYVQEVQHQVFSLPESNNMYMSLDHILAPASASVA